MPATREEWQALFDKAKAAGRVDLQRKIIEQLRAEKERQDEKAPLNEQFDWVKAPSVGTEISEGVKQVGSSLMGMVESGLKGIGDLLSGKDLETAAREMGETVEKRTRAASTPVAQDTMQMIADVGEVIDEATFKAGTVAEDIPVIGPAVATGIKMTGDLAIGLAPAAGVKLVSKGVKLKKAGSVAEATVDAEIEANITSKMRDDIFMRRQKYRKAKEDKILREIKKGKRSAPDSLDITESRFKARYKKSRQRSGEDLEFLDREANQAWRLYKKRKQRQNQLQWDKEEGAILQRLEDENFQRKIKGEIDLPAPTVMEKIHRAVERGQDTAGKLMGTMVTILDGIDPTTYLSKKSRQMEHEIESKMVSRNRDLDNFYQISEQMMKGKKAEDWKAAWVHGDINAMRQMAIEERPRVKGRFGRKVKEPDYKDTFDAVVFTLRDMGVEANTSGFRGFKLIGDTINSTYLPRHFSYKAIDRLKTDPELAKTLGFDKDKLDAALKAEFDDEIARTEAINSALLGGGGTRIPAPTPGSAKRRGKMNHMDLYDSPHESLHRYVNEMTEATAMRRFLGKRRVDNNADMAGSLAQFIEEHGEMMKLTPREQEILRYVYETRFKEGRMNANRFVQTVKNLGYLTTIGNAWSALTQIGDSIIAAGHLGPINVTKGLVDRVRGQGIKMQDIGYENIMKEMAAPAKSAKWLDWALRRSGFTAMDRFGKNVVVNGSRTRLMRKAKTEKGRKELARDYGKLMKDEDDMKKFLSDLEKGDVTNENVAFAIFNDLADLQPITLADMPISYLKNPTAGRLVWALKTWQANMVNKAWRDVVHEHKRGNRLTAYKNLTRFVFFNVIAGTASVDVFKEWIAKMAAGEELTGEDIEDHISEAFLRTAFVNKYAVDRMQAPTDLWNLGTNIWAPSLPGTLNRAYKGLTKEEKRDDLIKIMPIFGAAYGAYKRAEEGE